MARSGSIKLSDLPALPFAVASVAGVSISLFLNIPSQTIFVLAIALTLMAGLLLIFRASSGSLIAVIAVVFLFCWFRAAEDLNRDLRWRIRDISAQTEDICLIGSVAFSSVFAKNSYVVLEDVYLVSDSSSVYLGQARIRVFADSAFVSDLEYGDHVVASGLLHSASERTAAFSGSLFSALTQREVASLSSRPENLTRIAENDHHFARFVDNTRAEILNVFDKRLSSDASAIASALVLGDRSDFGYRFSENLRLTGLSHIFALSGLNTGMIISLIWFLLGSLFIPLRFRYWILLAAVLFYMELGREVPSLVRASLMCGMYIVGRLLHRRAHVLNYVLAALAIELLWRPMDLVDPGFALSYLAVLGMIAAFEILQHSAFLPLDVAHRKFGKFMREFAGGTLAAQAGTLPLSALIFSRIPFLGVFSNFVVIPGFALLLSLCMLLLLLAPVSAIAANAVSTSIELVALGLAWVVELFARIPFAALPIREFSFVGMISLYALITSIIVLAYKRRLAAAGLFLLLLANVLIWTPAFTDDDPTCRISFIDVGNGDAILFEAGDHAVLLDAGPHHGDFDASQIIATRMAERGITSLDAMFITHPDNDHVGGGAGLLDRFNIRSVYTNGEESTSRSFLEFKLACEVHGIQPQTLRAGDEFVISPDAVLTVLFPDSLAIAENAAPNRKGLVMRLDTPETSALFTADIDSSVEHGLIAWGGVIDTDLLKVAHHGSKSSSCSAFLFAVSPDVSIITAGRHNLYGHPSPEVLARLDSLKLDYLVTGKESTIEVATTGTGWKRCETSAYKLARMWNLPYV